MWALIDPTIDFGINANINSASMYILYVTQVAGLHMKYSPSGSFDLSVTYTPTKLVH